MTRIRQHAGHGTPAASDPSCLLSRSGHVIWPPPDSGLAADPIAAWVSRLNFPKSKLSTGWAGISMMTWCGPSKNAWTRRKRGLPGSCSAPDKAA